MNIQKMTSLRLILEKKHEYMKERTNEREREEIVKNEFYKKNEKKDFEILFLCRTFYL